MGPIIVFLLNHWVLSALFGVLLVAFIINEAMQRRYGVSHLSPEQAVQMINHEEAVVVDLRSETLFKEGHILGAINISAAHLDKKLNTLQKYVNKPIILVATAGQDASKVGAQLKEKGFQVRELGGGIQAWSSANLPLVKKK